LSACEEAVFWRSVRAGLSLNDAGPALLPAAEAEAAALRSCGGGVPDPRWLHRSGWWLRACGAESSARRMFALWWEARGAEGAGTKEWHYDRACAMALLGRLDESFAALRGAVDAGWVDASHAVHDRDLDVLREDPRWEPLLAEMRRRGGLGVGRGG
jgi:hypothetical protein